MEELKKWKRVFKDDPLYTDVKKWADQENLSLLEIPLEGLIRYRNGQAEVEVFDMAGGRPTIDPFNRSALSRWHPVKTTPPSMVVEMVDVPGDLSQLPMGDGE